MNNLFFIGAGVLLLTILLVLLWATRRIGQIFELLKENNRVTHMTGHRYMNDLFQQLQIVRILEHELGFDVPLPPLRGFAASPDFLLLIARHAHKHKPQFVVECSSGASTVVLARCMQTNGSGKVYSLEHDASFAQQTRDDLRKHGLEAWAEVVDAPLVAREIRETTWQWYSTEGLPGSAIEMLVVDGPPHFVNDLARYPAGSVLFPRLAPNAVVFVDDAKRSDEQEIVARWRKEFPTFRLEEHYCEKGCVSLTAP